MTTNRARPVSSVVTRLPVDKSTLHAGEKLTLRIEHRQRARLIHSELRRKNNFSRDDNAELSLRRVLLARIATRRAREITQTR